MLLGESHALSKNGQLPLNRFVGKQMRLVLSRKFKIFTSTESGTECS
jgi:hypothetical protein